jgi:hypothetical protein
MDAHVGRWKGSFPLSVASAPWVFDGENVLSANNALTVFAFRLFAEFFAHRLVEAALLVEKVCAGWLW